MKKLIKKISTIAWFICAFLGHGANVQVSWDQPSDTNGVTGYQTTIALGTNAPFATNITIGVTNTQTTFQNLLTSINYAVSVRSTGQLLSSPVGTNFVIPAPPLNLKLNSAMQQAPTPSGPWQDVTQAVTLVVSTEPNLFYRAKVAITP